MTLRPGTRLDAELTAGRRTLDVEGGRLFTADIARTKLSYSFTAKSMLRAIAQYEAVDRETSRYLSTVPRHSGTLLGSLLFSYRLNWQTVVFAGYGDDQVVNQRADLQPSRRTFFVKLSYALQR